MKKVVRILGCLALGAVVLTSCVKNEESDSVAAIRDAKAREINADARGTEIQNDAAALLYDIDFAAKQIKIDIEKATQEAKLVAANIALYKAEVGETNDHITALQAELTEIRTAIDNINKTLYGTVSAPGGILAEIASITKTMKTETDNLAAAAEVDKPAIQAKIDALTALRTALDAKKTSCVTELGVLNARLVKLNEAIGKL